jgi:hypothetical protein
VLAGASYVAFSLFGQRTPVGQVLAAGTPGSTKKGLYINLQPAPELPKTQPDLVGSLVQLKNNSLMVPPDSKAANSQEIPLTEVVVTNTTKVYHDITRSSLPANPDPNATYQQKLESFNIDQFLPGDQVIAFGDLRGSRLLATIVVVNLANR